MTPSTDAGLTAQKWSQTTIIHFPDTAALPSSWVTVLGTGFPAAKTGYSSTPGQLYHYIRRLHRWLLPRFPTLTPPDR